MATGTGRELRTTDRIERRLPVVVIHEGREIRANSRNISIGGLFFETADPLPADAEVLVRFTLPALPTPIEIEGEVRWIENDEQGRCRGVGLRFRGLRARDTWALTRYLSS